jgi:hypothetical protein
MSNYKITIILSKLSHNNYHRSTFLRYSFYLGIEASVWLELKEDCHKIVDINRSILYKWRNEHPGKAKRRELAQALCNIDMNIDAILSDVY